MVPFPFRNPWLVSLSISRTLMTMIFMVYAASLPVLLDEWQMSATTAGSIAANIHFSYAVSFLVFS